MICEVDDAGEILVPVELVQAAPHARIKADRDGRLGRFGADRGTPIRKSQRLIDSLPLLEGRSGVGVNKGSSKGFLLPPRNR